MPLRAGTQARKTVIGYEDQLKSTFDNKDALLHVPIDRPSCGVFRKVRPGFLYRKVVWKGGRKKGSDWVKRKYARESEVGHVLYGSNGY